jgi:hypothetical protein
LLADVVFELTLPSDQWMSTTSCSPQTAQPLTLAVAVLPAIDKLVEPLLFRPPVLQLGPGFVVKTVVVAAATRPAAPPPVANARESPAAATAAATATPENDLRTLLSFRCRLRQRYGGGGGMSVPASCRLRAGGRG